MEERSMKPIGDQVLIKQHEKKEKTSSGIIIMDGIDGEFVYADVVKTGDGLFTHTGDRIPMTCKVGDVVLVHKYNLGSQKEILLNGVEYILIRESELAMVSE
jgi:co-chaperonin GroES (HSP10)